MEPTASADLDVMVGQMAELEEDWPGARAAYRRALEQDPDSAYLHLRLAELATRLEDLTVALDYARRAVELEPEDDEARIFLGRLYRIQRDVAGAEAALTRDDGNGAAPRSRLAALLLFQIYLESGRVEDALGTALALARDDPRDLQATLALATAYEHQGRPVDAERALREGLAHHPDQVGLFDRLARSHRRRGDRKGEIDVYRQVLERHPEHYGTLMALGEAQFAAGDLPSATATFDRVVELYPGDVEALRRSASLLYAADRREEAAERLAEAVRRFPKRPELAYSLGRIFRALDRHDEAIEAFDRIPKGHRIYGEARLQVADILEGRGDFAGALREVTRAKVARPARALDFHAAVLQARAGDFEGAVAALEELRAQDPEDDEVLYQIGVLFGEAQRYEEAIEFMRLALEVNPENPHAMNFIGYTFAERGQNLEEAEDLIRKALVLRPDDGYITDSLGWVHYMQARELAAAGDHGRARELYERARVKLAEAAELTGGDPVVSEHLGDVHLALDDKVRALAFYEEAVSLEPREREQPHLFDKLERLRGELARP
ncbi:MAG: tetratricopeptide repeat protein [Proteobacteria bacterium]|nr:tetratricopeptide repeat protein [Pseudomonadota bacterium]